LEGINVLVGEKILFLANDGSTPAALRIHNRENAVLTESYFYIMMPIRK